MCKTEAERKNLLQLMLRRTDVPRRIYLRTEEDVIKQLSSIGSKTYMSSHKSLYGDAAQVKTLTEHEYQTMWANFRAYNDDLIKHPEATDPFKRTRHVEYDVNVVDSESDDIQVRQAERPVKNKHLAIRL